MAQVSKHFMAEKIRERIDDILVETVVRLDNKDRAKRLLDDLLTPTERVMLAKRLSIAYMLERGAMYRTISSRLKVSLGTIARVNRVRSGAGESFGSIIVEMARDKEIGKFFAGLLGVVGSLVPPPKGRDWRQWRKSQTRETDENIFG